MLSALLGMFFLISSGDFLMFFLSLELATIPVAAMANFDLHKKISSEGAMKFILSSAFSSGILLFGISLIYGATGTISFSEMPSLITGNPLQILAFVFLFTAFAFKMSIVPFHLWTADVYEGSPFAAASFLSVISKGAVAFIFITVLYKVFQPMQQVWYNMVMLLSIITMITGNLFALRQQNIKRFLAFSSIAQVGFILVGISGNSSAGVTSVVYFVLIYVFSNLVAFAVAAAVSAHIGKENITDYKGFYKTNSFLTWIMALALFSLAGIPPTAGFFGKLFLLPETITLLQSQTSLPIGTHRAVNKRNHIRLVISERLGLGKNKNPPYFFVYCFSLILFLLKIGNLIMALIFFLLPVSKRYYMPVRCF